MTRNRELTPAQATDLARYFLGPDWKAAAFEADHRLWAPGNGHYQGHTWRTVFRAAGVKLPVRPQFIAHKDRIMQQDKCVAVACSPTFASRTANALNEYDPDRRGI